MAKFIEKKAVELDNLINHRFITALDLDGRLEILEKFISSLFQGKHDGWIFKNKWGSFLSYFFADRRRDVLERIGSLRWKAWKAEGHKIVKVKFTEVK